MIDPVERITNGLKPEQRDVLSDLAPLVRRLAAEFAPGCSQFVMIFCQKRPLLNTPWISGRQERLPNLTHLSCPPPILISLLENPPGCKVTIRQRGRNWLHGLDGDQTAFVQYPVIAPWLPRTSTPYALEAWPSGMTAGEGVNRQRLLKLRDRINGKASPPAYAPTGT